jgi:RHS repeat-associated protein
LLSVNLPDGGLIEYVYDPLGRRIAKKVNGNIVEKYFWKGKTTLLAIYDGNDNLLMRFMYADARVPLAMTKDGLNYYLSYDQVGSLRLVTDTFGNVVKEIDYDSFGNVLADSDPTFTVPFGFAGGLYDVDTQLVHFGARDYNPDTGMWTAKDPIGFEGGDTDLYGYVDSVGKPLTRTNISGYPDLVRVATLETNLYSYSGNNPVNFIDPDGEFWMAVVAGVVAAIYLFEIIYEPWMLPKGSPPGSLAPGYPGPVGPDNCPVQTDTAPYSAPPPPRFEPRFEPRVMP